MIARLHNCPSLLLVFSLFLLLPACGSEDATKMENEKMQKEIALLKSQLKEQEKGNSNPLGSGSKPEGSDSKGTQKAEANSIVNNTTNSINKLKENIKKKAAANNPLGSNSKLAKNPLGSDQKKSDSNTVAVAQQKSLGNIFKPAKPFNNQADPNKKDAGLVANKDNTFPVNVNKPVVNQDAGKKKNPLAGVLGGDKTKAKPPLPNIVGQWKGTASEALDNGASVNIDLHMTFSNTAQGIQSIMNGTARVPAGDGSTLTVKVEATFAGSMQVNKGVLKSTAMKVYIVENNQVIPSDPQQMEFTLLGNNISGRIGDDVEGWATFKATRMQTTVTPKPNPFPQPGPNPNPLPQPGPNPNPIPNPNPVNDGGDIFKKGKQGAQGISSLPVGGLVSHLPEAATSGPPSWVQQGTRILYWATSATLAYGNFSKVMIEDPNGPFTDPQSGKKFRYQYTPGSGGTGKGGMAGAGYRQLDVTSVSKAAVALDSREYFSPSGQQGPATQQMSFKAHVIHPSGFLYWINPSLLAKMQPQAAANYRVYRGPWQMNGQEFQALLIDTGIAESSDLKVYDLKSGLLLYSSVKAMVGGGAKKQLTLSNTTFVSARQVQWPWKAQVIPAHLRKGLKQKFAGAKTMVMHGGMMDPISMKITAESTVLSRTEDWLNTEVLIQMNIPNNPSASQPQKSMSIIGKGGISGVYFDPTVLSGLQAGRVIDEDPTTGIRLSVGQQIRDQAGRAVFTFVEENRMFKTTWFYGLQDGRSLGFKREVPSPDGQTTDILEMYAVDQ